MKQNQTSLRSLHKMIAATRRYHHEHRIRSARGERRLERRGIASRAQPGGGLAQECLELGEELLDRVEVWRIGRQAEQPGAARLDGRAHACDLVRAEIVQDDDVAGPQRRCEHLLDIGAEPFAVDRSTMTKGAVSPSQRRPATKVVVFQ